MNIKISLGAVAIAMLVVLSSAGGPAAFATEPASAPEVGTVLSGTSDGSVAPKGAVGPCSQQPSGVRVWHDFVVWKFQNCNTSSIRIKAQKFHAGQNVYYWGECNTVQPGKVLEVWGDGTGSYRTC